MIDPSSLYVDHEPCASLEIVTLEVSLNCLMNSRVLPSPSHVKSTVPPISANLSASLNKCGLRLQCVGWNNETGISALSNAWNTGVKLACFPAIRLAVRIWEAKRTSSSSVMWLDLWSLNASLTPRILSINTISSSTESVSVYVGYV